MTKVGFNQVLVSTTVYERLKTIATENGLSFNKVILKLLDNPSIDTGIDTTTQIGNNQRPIQFLGPKMEQNQTYFVEKEGVGTLVPSMAGPAGPG